VSETDRSAEVAHRIVREVAMASPKERARVNPQRFVDSIRVGMELGQDAEARHLSLDGSACPRRHQPALDLSDRRGVVSFTASSQGRSRSATSGQPVNPC
jgi:hypothetical protein